MQSGILVIDLHVVLTSAPVSHIGPDHEADYDELGSWGNSHVDEHVRDVLSLREGLFVLRGDVADVVFQMRYRAQGVGGQTC
jgi:hypothetical protein